MKTLHDTIEGARRTRQRLDDALNIIDRDVKNVDGLALSNALEATSSSLHLIIIALEKIETRLFIAEG